MIKFKSVDPFYSKELNGMKNNTVRKDDEGERFIRLFIFSRNLKYGVKDELKIEITNPQTGLSFMRNIRDVSIFGDFFIITWDDANV